MSSDDGIPGAESLLPRVLGFGQCSLDYLVAAEDYPPPDSKTVCHDLVVAGGGPVATALVALARWGLGGEFWGVVGDDAFGERIQAELVAEGVGTRGLLVREGEASQFSFVVRDPAGGRTIFCRRPTGAPPRREELPSSLPPGTRLLLTDGLWAEPGIALAEEARERGIPLVVDAGTLREGWQELAQRAAVFVTSRAFSEALSGPGGEEETCRRLEEMGVRWAGVTLGGAGSLARCEGEWIRTPTYPVEVVDSTGCGDLFHAGLCLGWIQGRGARESFRLASWVAARGATRVGGRAGIPDLGEDPGSDSPDPDVLRSPHRGPGGRGSPPPGAGGV